MADKLKPTIVRDGEGYWSILETDKDGNQRTRGNMGHIPPIEEMEEREALLVFLDLADKASTKRVGAVSLLTRIMQEGLARIEAWQGKGDASKGLDNELKGAFQKCEDKYFEKYMDVAHPDHPLFVGRLPKLDSRGNPLEIDGKLTPAKQFEAFLTATRKEPTYAANKNTILSYFSFCGKLPLSDDGTLVPPEVMAQEVQNARVIVPKDNSFKARLWEMRNELLDEAKVPPGDDLPAILRTLREMTDYAQQLENIHAARLTAAGGARVGDSVQARSDEAIRKAQESTGRVAPEVPALPAPAKPEAKEIPQEPATAQ